MNSTPEHSPVAVGKKEARESLGAELLQFFDDGPPWPRPIALTKTAHSCRGFPYTKIGFSLVDSDDDFGFNVDLKPRAEIKNSEDGVAKSGSREVRNGVGSWFRIGWLPQIFTAHTIVVDSCDWL